MSKSAASHRTLVCDVRQPLCVARGEVSIFVIKIAFVIQNG